MKKVWKKGIALLICFTLNSSIVVFADENQEGNADNTAEYFNETNVVEENTMEQYAGEEEPEGKELEPSIIPETSDVPGWKEIDNNLYYYDADMKRAEGWRKINNVWYYFDGSDENYPGIMLKDIVREIEGKYYLFHSDGAMLTGWIKRMEGWYYANANGSLVLGWKKSGNKWYYLDGNNSEHIGLMAENANMLINGKYYGFNANGAMLTGWIEREEGWYYANPSGDFAMKWKKIGSKWYYFNPDDIEHPGRMLSDVSAEIDGLSYTFLPSGAMKTGWEKVGEDWYYYHTNSGQLVTGWNKIGGKWYYFMPDTKQMAPAGWHEIEGTYYYMNANGDMATGWKKINDKWYYLGGNGKMRVGWQKISGFWYYFYTQNDPYGGTYGVMASNTTIDGYKILPNGMYLNPVQARMYAMAQGYSSNTGYLIMVDTTNCIFGVFTGLRGNWKFVKYWSCSPGAPATPTVKGVFSVGGKGYYFDSGNLRLYWYTQFFGDYLIHSVCYLHDGTPADLRTGMHLSHGCVRLQIDNAKWVYDNVPRGSTVVTY